MKTYSKKIHSGYFALVMLLMVTVNSQAKMAKSVGKAFSHNRDFMVKLKRSENAMYQMELTVSVYSKRDCRAVRHKEINDLNSIESNTENCAYLLKPTWSNKLSFESVFKMHYVDGVVSNDGSWVLLQKEMPYSGMTHQFVNMNRP